MSRKPFSNRREEVPQLVRKGVVALARAEVALVVVGDPKDQGEGLRAAAVQEKPRGCFGREAAVAEALREG